MIFVAFAVGLIFLTLIVRAMERLEVLHFTLLSVPFMIFGIFVLDSRYWWCIAALAAAYGAMVFGYILVRRHWSGSSWRGRIGDLQSCGHFRRLAPGACLIVGIGCAYHFAVVGIPIFSSSVEVSRFDVGASGLGGIPSRLYLFGPLIALALSVREAQRRGVGLVHDRWVRVAISILVLSRLASGFKSGIVQAFSYTLLVAVVAGVVIPMARYWRRALAAIVLVVISVLSVGSQYSTYQASGRSVVEILVSRLTGGSGEPPAVLMSLPQGFFSDDRSIIGIDFLYFLGRYFGIGPGEQYSFVRMFAAYIYGVPPLPDLVIQPVTTGAFAELFYDFGWAGMVVGGGVLGGLLAYFAAKAVATTGSGAFACCCVGVQCVLDYISKGGLVYLFVNWASSLLLVLFLASVAWLLFQAFGSTPGSSIEAASAISPNTRKGLGCP
jgi:hypothetical protein